MNDNSDMPTEKLSRVEILGCLKDFLQLQDRRVQIYRRFDQGFAEYLSNGHEGTYQRLCHQITREFSECSKQVNDVEAKLRKKNKAITSNGYGDGDGEEEEEEEEEDEEQSAPSDFADWIRAVQGQEKQKLEMTAILQVLKKAGRPSERRRAGVRSPQPTLTAAAASSLSSSSSSSISSSSSSRHPSGGEPPSSHGHCCHFEQQLSFPNSNEGIEGVEEAQLEAEYDGAIEETTQALQQSILAINDKLEEVRYAIAELEEDDEEDS